MNFEIMIQSVHGGRKFHFGAYETYRRLKVAFPDANISIRAVREWVQQCPMCQKLRDTGIKGLPSANLTLKQDNHRLTVGFDHLSITPPDIHGNTCVIMIVEHFSHFPQAYPVKDYTTDTLAKVLFKHYCTFGMFHQVACDPGSTNMGQAIDDLNMWLQIQPKVSLVGRHQSNGCEGSNKQFLRHLKSLVLDSRLVDRWSDDTVLPLVNFMMASFPTRETGGYTPFELKYGSVDAKYFHLPDADVHPGVEAKSLIRQLNDNLRIIRQKSFDLQRTIIEERAQEALRQHHYEPGDLILWDPLENNPAGFLPTKLSPNWRGPYTVICQVKNDIHCRHVVTRDDKYLHMSHVKPYFGSDDSAFDIAKRDNDQYVILSINCFTGNPQVRTRPACFSRLHLKTRQ
jgi:hypothetical protein